MNKAYIGLGALLLSSCQSSLEKLPQPGISFIDDELTTAYRIILEDGAPAWLVQCPGPENTFANCRKRAQVMCKTGFLLLRKETEADGGYVQIGPSTESQAAPGKERTVIVLCD